MKLLQVLPLIAFVATSGFSAEPPASASKTPLPRSEDKPFNDTLELIAGPGPGVPGLLLPTKGIRYLEPDEQTGTSKAVFVQDEPLLHTDLVFPIQNFNAALNPKSKMGDIEKQTWLTLANLGYIAEFSRCVKLNIYLAHLEDKPKVQEVLSRFTQLRRCPAVTYVVGGLPSTNLLIAMDAVAASPNTPPTNRVQWLEDHSGYAEKGIHHAAILPAGPKVYISGMADTNSLPEATKKTLEKLGAAIGHMGLGKQDIVQLKAFMQPISEAPMVRSEILDFFGGDAPPMVFVEWISPPPNPPIEIELIAAAKGDFSKEPDTVTYLTPPGTTSTKVYSRVARVNHGKLVYISNLYGHSPDAAGQVREIFNSLGEILTETGGDFEHLVKATYYVSDDDASNKLNDLRPKFYNPQRPPAASKAKVESVGQTGKTVTMDMIAVVK